MRINSFEWDKVNISHIARHNIREQWGQISTFNKNADIKEFEKMLKVEI